MVGHLAQWLAHGLHAVMQLGPYPQRKGFASFSLTFESVFIFSISSLNRKPECAHKKKSKERAKKKVWHVFRKENKERAKKSGI